MSKKKKKEPDWFCYRKCREKLESSADTFKSKRRKNLKKGKQITETCDKFYVVNGRTSRNTNKIFKTWNPDFFLQIILH